jgi:hypothetical protein
VSLSFSLKHLNLVIMASHPAPKPRMSDAERRAARGHTHDDLVTRTRGHIGKLIQKTVVRPTLVGQERTKRRFLDFLQILSKSDPSVLEELGCTDDTNVLKPGTYSICFQLVRLVLSKCFCFAVSLCRHYARIYRLPGRGEPRNAQRADHGFDAHKYNQSVPWHGEFCSIP